ncbi:hypothetical protein LTR84_006115 [Exophiala bonariae]|uniref:Ig-like domain-containing protein n=1 Tax=Exophiala bonariae TaxID=1690606 RepID=A0AAV9N1U9_9EURO|nr:hypothetical protein LTR84_006115 [Exophiala bonariae]
MRRPPRRRALTSLEVQAISLSSQNTSAALASWINLPGPWSLQNVQAALNVVVTGLSVLAVFACARFCWQSSVTSSARYSSVPASALLSISTFGEAIDVIWLLKAKIFSRRHVKILVQASLVVFLSFTALISGPIARYSTRLGHRISHHNTPGKITWRRHDSILGASVIWNQTTFSLDNANFPYNQLLDYLPDPSINWIYDPKEWNSSWTLECSNTDLSHLTLDDVGNCTSISDEIPGLAAVISLEKYDRNNISAWWTGYYEDGINKDVLLGIGAAKESLVDENTGIVRQMDIDLAAVHLHNVNIQSDSDSFCYFGEGPIESASFTKIECRVQRIDQDPKQLNIAFPDGATPWLVGRALVQNYQAQFIRESIRGDNVTVITPQDLTRFYQVWVATKDTQNGFPVSRQLSVRLPIVQLSTTFLALAILTLLLIILGIGSYVFAALRYRKVFEETPQSKLEWMLKVIREHGPAEVRDGARTSSFIGTQDSTSPLNFGSPPDKNTSTIHSSPTAFSPTSLKRSTTARMMSIASSVQQSAERRRSEFENARYSNNPGQLDDGMSPQAPGDRQRPSPYSLDGFSFGSNHRQRPESFRSQSESGSYSHDIGRQVYTPDSGLALTPAENSWRLPPLPFHSLGTSIPRKAVGSPAYTSVSINELPPQNTQQQQSHSRSQSWRGPGPSDAENPDEIERLVVRPLSLGQDKSRFN